MHILADGDHYLEELLVRC